MIKIINVNYKHTIFLSDNISPTRLWGLSAVILLVLLFSSCPCDSHTEARNSKPPPRLFNGQCYWRAVVKHGSTNAKQNSKERSTNTTKRSVEKE